MITSEPLVGSELCDSSEVERLSLMVLLAGLEFTKPGERNPGRRQKQNPFCLWNEASLQFRFVPRSIMWGWAAVKSRDERQKKRAPLTARPTQKEKCV